MSIQPTLVLLLVCLATCYGEQPKVKTNSGIVAGIRRKADGGTPYLSFEGIPYAKPPLGDLRYKDAVPIDKPWPGEWNASAPGSSCLQYNHLKQEEFRGRLRYGVEGDEDCLFLNVYTPDTGAKNRDVLVFIHGGAFMFGHGALYGPEYLMDKDDLVYVTINYRLGPLGFLSTGDSVLPGNLGLKDQSQALKWVQNNIASFGGDPSKVTIGGLSAGGASVHFHYLSLLSDGLFNKGYSFSGTATCPWALVSDAPEKTKKLASLLGCPTTDSKALVKCLRKRPARQIVQQVEFFQSYLYTPFTVFGPVVEVGSKNAFIDQHPVDLIKKGQVKDLPWVTGVTTEEGLYPAAEFVDDEVKLKKLNEDWLKIAPSLLFYRDTQPAALHEKIAADVRQAYLGDKEISRETVQEVIQMLSDRLFIAPSVESAVLQARQNTQPVYAYLFSYVGQQSVSQLVSGTKTLFGSCHADDMSYVVKFLGQETHTTEKDAQIADVLFDILLTFVKTGELPAQLGWEAVSRSPQGNFKYLKIDSPEEIQLKSDSSLGNLKTLTTLIPKSVALHDEL